MVVETTQHRLPAGEPTFSLEQASRFYDKDLATIARYRRATNYLAAAQLYLKRNFLLEEPLRPEHIKDRLLGHWGTCPGINLIYAHLNALIVRHNLEMFLVTGPGHGAPANLANLYLEGSLQDFYPELTLDRKGLETFIRYFSWPGGFPSHLCPAIPGTIHEGGELGYALATAYGAIMDNPDLIVACIVGDGEAETGATATAWHSYKFIDPRESGAVLPILHLNGYKISNPTIFGTMTNDELYHLFTGYGYQVQIVQGDEQDSALYSELEWAYHEIRRIQKAARAGDPLIQPRWPMLILRSLKGESGIKEMYGKPIEGSFRSHQVPASDLRSNLDSLRLVEEWLRSYHIEELFDTEGRPFPDILELCPRGKQRMGSNRHTFGGRVLQELHLPEITRYEFPVTRETAGNIETGNIEQLAGYLATVIAQNPHIFRIFCPDEMESNKLGKIFEVTQRCYQWPVQAHDSHTSANGGRVLEILSEHTCQAWLQGYLLTGRHGLFPSYEAFLTIISSMMDQYAKFLKLSQENHWRLPVASLTYLATSTLWRQEHNGYSHQNPAFINAILNKKAEMAQIFLPPDANSLIFTIDQCLRSRQCINLVIANKQPMRQWLSMSEAAAHCRAGASIWHWASTEDGVDPDVVLVGIGDNPTLEVMAAAQLIRTELPEMRLRVVNIVDLMALAKDSEHPHGLSAEMFDALFPLDRPIIINFHGYPSAIRQLLFGRPRINRFCINGYIEEGTTTTPFDMNVRNGTSRYQLVMQAISLAACNNARVAARASERFHHYEYILADHRRFIQEHGFDPEDITHWQWS